MSPPIPIEILAARPSPAPSPFSGPGAGIVSPATGSSAWVLNTAVWAARRPWLLAVAAAGLVVYIAARNVLEGWRHRRHAEGARVVTIAPPPEVDAHGAQALWANLAGTLTPSRRRRLVYGSPHVVWQTTAPTPPLTPIASWTPLVVRKPLTIQVAAFPPDRPWRRCHAWYYVNQFHPRADGRTSSQQRGVVGCGRWSPVRGRLRQ